VPHAANGVLYVKLRDDPATVQTLTLPVTLVSPAESRATAAQAQPASAPEASSPPGPSVTEPVTLPDAQDAKPEAPPDASSGKS
jgi:hypothetical protein